MQNNQTISKPALTQVTSTADLVPAVNRMVQAMTLLVGQHRDKEERAVTFKDLRRSGFDITGLTSNGGQIVPPMPDSNLPDMSVPPAVIGFHLEPTLTQVLCMWEPAQYKNHAYVEIWVAPSLKNVGGQPMPTVLGDAHFFGYCPTTSVGISGLPEDSFRVWARNVSYAGVAGPWQDEAGTVASIPANPSYLIDKISGEIREGDLYPALGQKIDDTDARSVANASALIEQAQALADQGQILVQHGDSISAANSSISNLQAISTNQGSIITQMQTTLSSHGASITSIQQINATQDQTISSMQTTLSSHGSSITSIQQINAAQDQTITTYGNTLSSHESSISSIQQINATQDQTISSMQTTLSSHGSSILSIQQINTTQDQTLTTYGNTLSSHGASITSLQQITTSHDSQLLSVNNTLSAHGTAIQQQTTINTNQGNLINAAYSLRIDSGGAVSGFGLMADGTTNRSQFIIRADQFAIAAPQQYDVNGKPIVQTAAFPFIVDVTDPNNPKTLIKNAYISNAFIESIIAGKVNADYVNAMTLNAVKITGGTLAIGSKFSVDAYGNMITNSATMNYMHSQYADISDATLNNCTINGALIIRNLQVASGTIEAFKIRLAASKKSGWVRIAVATIDTGYAVGAWWDATDRSYRLIAGITGGTVVAESAIIPPTWGFTANWAIKVVDYYTKSRWASDTTIIATLELWAEVDGTVSVLDFTQSNPKWVLQKIT